MSDALSLQCWSAITKRLPGLEIDAIRITDDDAGRLDNITVWITPTSESWRLVSPQIIRLIARSSLASAAKLIPRSPHRKHHFDIFIPQEGPK